MATEPATAVLPLPTAAAPAPDPNLVRNAEEHVDAADRAFAGHSLPEPFPNPAGDSAAGGELDRLLAGAKTVDEIERLSRQLLAPENRPAVATGPQEKDYPGGPPQEAEGHPEDAFQALEEGKPLPPRLRIKSLPIERQKLLVQLAKPGANVAEILRDFAAPATATSTAAAPLPPATIPGLPATPSARPIDPAALAPPTESSQALRNLLADLRQQRITAQRGLDYETADVLEDRIEQIRSQIPQVEQAERSHGQAKGQAYETSIQTAAELYPDLNADTPMLREVMRLDAEAKRNADPLYNHHDKPFLLASRAAANLGIAPQRTGTPGAPAVSARQPAPVAAFTPRAAAPNAAPPAPAAGGARTQAPSADADQAQFEQALDSAKDTNSILALTRLLG